jgi:hypothetical protein
MQKWEYLEVSFEFFTDGFEVLKQWENGVELHKQKMGEKVADYLNQYGSQGWELVDRGGRADSERRTYVFKRPIL